MEQPFPAKLPATAISRRTALLAPVLLSAIARPAEAHAVLVASSPAANATIPVAQTYFQLRFNTRVDQARSRLTLYAADGNQSVLTILPVGEPDMLTAVAIVTEGGQTLRWQVLAADGHITRGDIPFKAVRT